MSKRTLEMLSLCFVSRENLTQQLRNRRAAGVPPPQILPSNPHRLFAAERGADGGCIGSLGLLYSYSKVLNPLKET
jgi:hypothetical protein